MALPGCGKREAEAGEEGWGEVDLGGEGHRGIGGDGGLDEEHGDADFGFVEVLPMTGDAVFAEALPVVGGEDGEVIVQVPFGFEGGEDALEVEIGLENAIIVEIAGGLAGAFVTPDPGVPEFAFVLLPAGGFGKASPEFVDRHEVEPKEGGLATGWGKMLDIVDDIAVVIDGEWAIISVVEEIKVIAVSASQMLEGGVIARQKGMGAVALFLEDFG